MCIPRASTRPHDGSTRGFAQRLRQYRRRRAVLRSARALLHRTEVELHEHAVNLVLLGSLHEWANVAPVGTVVHFDDELLSTTGDRYVLALVGLRAAAARVIEIFEKGVA